LHLREATIVARGACCPFAIKLLSPTASRSFSNENVKRLVLLNPKLSGSFINSHLLDATFLRRLNDVELSCAYESDRERQKRDAILRHYCPQGESIVWTDGTIEQSNMEVLLAIFVGNTKDVKTNDEDVKTNDDTCHDEHCHDHECNNITSFDDDRYDDLGRKVFIGHLTVVMDPDSKMDVQLSEHVTYADMTATSSTTSSATTTTEGMVDVNNCVRECGALILRGNRIVLSRDLENDATIMSIPSCELDICCNEDPMACALRSIDEKCDIDDPTEQVIVLNHLLPVRLFRPNGENKIVDIYFMYSKNPPPSDAGDDEDYEDLYDWYTFVRS